MTETIEITRKDYESLRECWYSFEAALSALKAADLGADPEKAYWLIEPAVEKPGAIMGQLAGALESACPIKDPEEKSRLRAS